MNEIVTFFGIAFGLQILMIIVALAFLIPGFVMFTQEKKKRDAKKEYDETRMWISIVLMGIGMVIGLGFGFSIFFESLGNML